MIYHVPFEKIGELSREQRENLHDWWERHRDFGSLYIEPRQLDEEPLIYVKARVFSFGFSPPGKHPSQEALPLLSIGEMIDLLAPKREMKIIGDISPSIGTWEPSEMCIRLWELVKEKL